MIKEQDELTVKYVMQIIECFDKSSFIKMCFKIHQSVYFYLWALLASFLKIQKSLVPTVKLLSRCCWKRSGDLVKGRINGLEEDSLGKMKLASERNDE